MTRAPSFGDYRDRTPPIVIAVGGALIGAGLWLLLILILALGGVL